MVNQMQCPLINRPDYGPDLGLTQKIHTFYSAAHPKVKPQQRLVRLRQIAFTEKRCRKPTISQTSWPLCRSERKIKKERGENRGGETAQC